MSERIVIKIGTGVLTRDAGIGIDEPIVARLADTLATLAASGHEIILVSSGAVGTALSELAIDTRPTDVAELQSLAAIGQARLMQIYNKHLGTHGLTAGQMLLTYSDLESDGRRERVMRTLEALVARPNVIPIINENDTVAVEELRYGDNDTLSAVIATLGHADKLVLLTSVDGLLATGPNGESSTIEEISDFTAALSHVKDEKGRLSVGGMASKLDAARRAVENGVETWIANGKRCQNLHDMLYGNDKRRTRITPTPPPPKS
ncbi:glutamate 5-kinase [Sulfuriroseicoccus oceanibius]|uniref:Glutamate 5-kinase n=1 Tax=Sulfuriroseicoccus oceanibius TaxID=2707525 RepID=A0A6B3L1L4_9BACT|nr:glutamate 5-kinase [Sulfuriroseicoccus oceanibius]QQL46192.1 glutamate 5-kinase [Sulfuriroseicoccus oceanibius]